DEGTPVVVVATSIHVYDKIVSNIQETRARGAHVIAIATDGNEDIQHHADDVISVPRTPAFLQAALAIVPLQLLAYRIARLRELNVDQTRRARYEGRGLFGTPTFVPEAQWVDSDGVRLRVLASDDAPGVYLHVHGGGWTFGGADLQDVALRQLVRETGVAVASVEYRLAPEHPF